MTGSSKLLCAGLSAAACLLFSCASGGKVMADEILFDFEAGLSRRTMETRDVKVTRSRNRSGHALRITSFHHQAWPGITLKAKNGRWDLSRYRYISLDVFNVGSNTVTVSCRVDNPGADGRRNCNTGNVTLEPGRSGTIRVVFARRPTASDAVKLFGMRGYPVPQASERAIDPSNVTQLIIFVPRPQADHVFEIDNIRAAGEYVPPPPADKFFPFIDEFGQYIHKDWPGKLHSGGEFGTRAAAEAKDVAVNRGPAGWDEYGGWNNGPALEATGHFRTQKYKGKWWLVDPRGKLFFSHGIDCVNSWGSTPIEDRGHWFRGLQGGKSQFGGFYSTARAIKGYYKGRKVKCFDFIRANLLRKFGAGWQAKSAELAHLRLRSWGMNTIGNWSDSNIYLLRKTPYVVAVHFRSKVLQGSEGYWRQFPDVFDADFKARIRSRMNREKGKSAGDPWCIGYFVDNELSWGDDVSLAVAALASPPDQAAKQVFVGDLKNKYRTIRNLNRVWGTQHASWDALLQHRGAPDKKKARQDLAAFYIKTAERYFTTCREAVKEVAPQNLYLGCRFAWVNDAAAAVAANYCDVVGYNLYRRSVADFQFNADVPLMIGEFHFGALDRGMFHTGLVPVKDQAERAKTYVEYVQGVLRHPLFVGCHWFKYRDEPTTGRPLDEENYQIGFVDVTDTAYPETLAACREVGYSLYDYRFRGGK